MTAVEARKRSLLARAARFVVIGLVALPLVYLAAANAFLSFGGINAMFAGTNTVSAKYRSAYSLWPGRVHVRDLRIVFQDHNLQWSLDFERVTAELRLTELVRHTFHASKVLASGGVFRFRHRIDPESKGEPWVSTLPPIPEFVSPAVFEARVPEPPIPDDKYNLWTVHLENVDAQVNELWLQFIRYRGSGRASGAFELVPARRLWVGPAALVLAPGRVQLGQDELGTALAGRIDCRVDPFDVRAPVGREVFRYINTDVKLVSPSLRPATLLQLFELRSRTAIESEPGKLEISVALKRGQLQQGSEVSFATANAAVRLEREAVIVRARELRLLARMTQDARGETSLTAARVELTREPGTPPSVELSQLSAFILTRGDDTAGEWELEGRSAAVQQLKIADTRALNPFLGSSRRRFAGGSLEGRLSLGEMGEARRADFALRARELRAEWDGAVLALRANLSGHGAAERDARTNLELALKGQVERLRWARRGLAAQPPFLLELGGATIDVNVARRSEDRLEGKLELRATSLTARTTLVDGEGSARLRGVTVRASARQAKSPQLSGELAFNAEHGEVALGSRKIRAIPGLRLRLDGFDLDARSGRLASALQLKDLVAVHGDATGQCSTIHVPEARLTLDGEAREGRGALRAALELGRSRFDWGDFEASASGKLAVTLADLELASGAGRMALAADLVEPTLSSGKGGSKGWYAAAPKVSAKLVAWSGSSLLGSLSLDAADVHGRIGGTRVRSDFRATLPVVSADLAQRTARFSGALQLTQAEVYGERAVRDWWARIDVRSGLLAARQNVDLSALFSAKLRDVTPGVEILDEGGALPGWVAGFVPKDELSAEGIIERRCRLTEIQLTRALDGPLALRGRLQSVPESVRGAFLLRLRAAEGLSAGVAFDPADTHVALLGGDGWFREQSAALDRSARNVLEGPCVVPDQSCGLD